MGIANPHVLYPLALGNLRKLRLLNPRLVE